MNTKDAKHLDLPQLKSRLRGTDYALIRSVEDIVDALVKAGILKRSLLPEDVWDIIEERKELRKKIREIVDK